MTVVYVTNDTRALLGEIKAHFCVPANPAAASRVFANKGNDDAYWQYQKVQVSTDYPECFNTLPVPVADVESPVRCRCVYGYGVDASDRPSYLLWPRQGSDGHFWLMDPRGKFFDPAKQPSSHNLV